ncbi:alpha/beta fold hydrolase [Modicisalibacter radicis]|uniref:alpha/beta fold hydrolase n=1 Tax=Halomonas sp. EAR18 TaxID=2518972 RepID=UPI001443ED8A|nr:alpha/beta hydrolase [Halomonas sp. EAR18]
MAASILDRHSVTVTGQGERTLLLLHGFGCDQRVWAPLVRAFEADWRVVRYDQAGCGRALKSAYRRDRYATLQGYAGDLLAICEALGDRAVTVVGHSISGIIAMLAAIEAPQRFQQLVMLCASSRYLDDPPDYQGGFDEAQLGELLTMMEQNYFAWAGSMAAEVIGPQSRNAAERHLRNQFLASDARIARQFAEVTFYSDTRAALPQLTTPTLVMHTEEDAVVPQQAAEYLHANIPDSRLEWLPCRGHYPHMSAPGLLVERLRTLL